MMRSGLTGEQRVKMNRSQTFTLDGNFRLLENSDFRLLENGDFRLLE
jgi:hypothetical protein